MIGIYYFSAAGHSKAAAEFFSENLHALAREIGTKTVTEEDTAVIVFPVYCQNIPEPVKAFLPNVRAKYVALIATYGQMGCGNVLWEATKLVKGQVIAGAYVPTGHTYLSEGAQTDYTPLQPVLERIQSPRPVTIPKKPKWWLADFLPDLRSRISVKIQKTHRCTQCGLCNRDCPMGAMEMGSPGKGCIRCLRCVTQCPQKALEVSYHPLLKSYLRKKRQTDWILYM